MDCNRQSVSSFDIDYDTPRCNRAKLDTGTFCNYDCEFCYYKELLHEVTSFEVIKDRADKIHQYGIKEVDLSGGESSVHRQWFDILDYCDERFDHISTLSNGQRFANEKFLLKSKEHGLKEILFSVHGYDEESHDTIVQRKGAWNKIHQAIELCHKHGIIVRVNCTVYQLNYEGLDTYHEVIEQIKPLEVNFLTLNYWTNNKHAEPIDYPVVTEYIKRCIDRIKPFVKYINVRYTPYCYMKGYEQYVCDLYQHIYDRYDWEVGIYDLVAGDVPEYDYDIDPSKQYTEKQKIDNAYRAAERVRLRDYQKPANCLLCKFYYICDGVEHQVKKCEVRPEKGKKITDVNHFRKGFYKDAQP